MTCSVSDIFSRNSPSNRHHSSEQRHTLSRKPADGPDQAALNQNDGHVEETKDTETKKKENGTQDEHQGKADETSEKEYNEVKLRDAEALQEREPREFVGVPVWHPEADGHGIKDAKRRRREGLEALERKEQQALEQKKEEVQKLPLEETKQV